MGRFFVIRATPASLPSNPSMSATALNDRHDQPSGCEVHRCTGLFEAERTLERHCSRLSFRFHRRLVPHKHHWYQLAGARNTRHAVANPGLGFGPNPQWKNHKMRGCFTLTRQDRRELPSCSAWMKTICATSSPLTTSPPARSFRDPVPAQRWHLIPAHWDL